MAGRQALVALGTDVRATKRHAEERSARIVGSQRSFRGTYEDDPVAVPYEYLNFDPESIQSSKCEFMEGGEGEVGRFVLRNTKVRTTADILRAKRNGWTLEPERVELGEEEKRSKIPAFGTLPRTVQRCEGYDARNPKPVMGFIRAREELPEEAFQIRRPGPEPGTWIYESVRNRLGSTKFLPITRKGPSHSVWTAVGNGVTGKGRAPGVDVPEGTRDPTHPVGCKCLDCAYIRASRDAFWETHRKGVGPDATDGWPRVARQHHDDRDYGKATTHLK